MLNGTSTGGTRTTIEPHNSTPFETLGNLGNLAVAWALTGVPIPVALALPRLTWPLAMTGSMTLTLYATRILVIAFFGNEIHHAPANVALAALSEVRIPFAYV